jgi:hypothetical protein
MALQRFDFDQRYFIEPGYIVKDHTLVEADDGTYHLFYIKADETLPEGQRAKTLGHSTSTDLTHWTPHPDVIPVVPGTWEEAFVWAHIVPPAAVLMYYTGELELRAGHQGRGEQRPVPRTNTRRTGLHAVPARAAWASNTWSNCHRSYSRAGRLVHDHHGVANTSRAISLASSTDLTIDRHGSAARTSGPTQTWHVLSPQPASTPALVLYRAERRRIVVHECAQLTGPGLRQ